jgi:hypothetical protein
VEGDEPEGGAKTCLIAYLLFYLSSLGFKSQNTSPRFHQDGIPFLELAFKKHGPQFVLEEVLDGPA